MNGWACVLSPDGRAAGELHRLCSRVDGEGRVDRVEADGFAGAASRCPATGRRRVAARGRLLLVGDVRLDDPREVAGWGTAGPARGDADLVLAAFEARGPACFAGLLGDFAFGLWDARDRSFFAVRDAFGVRALYHRGGHVFSSRLPAADGEPYDEGWIAEFLLGGSPAAELTPFARWSALAPASVAEVSGGRVAIRRYWSPEAFVPGPAGSERDQVEGFAARLEEAVRCRMAGEQGVWAHLSGGLDSSSVVSLASRMAERGEAPALAGTVTGVDTLGEGDERRYSDAVVRRYRLRNEQVVDCWPWQDDGAPPPVPDEPSSHFPFWARDRRVTGLVKAAGGRVVLTGTGSDNYLAGSMGFVADLVARGHPLRALAEVARFSVAERVSFWRGVGQMAVLPLLPAMLRRPFEGASEALPGWVDAGFARRTAIHRRSTVASPHHAPRGGLFAAEAVHGLAIAHRYMAREDEREGVEPRHPFLDRRLVEFSLGLPPEARIRPRESKWVLREAMRGILPEEVRTRRSKGGIDARFLWALNREAPRLDRLLRDPISAQLGWVRADALRGAVEQARSGTVPNAMYLLAALSLESWLAVRSGRWAEWECAASTAA